MVKQLLAFAGGSDGERRMIAVQTVVTEVRSILEHTFSKSIHIQTALAPDLCEVHADPTQISQVLMNLCVNARDAMPGGGTLTIAAENVNLTAEFVRHHADAAAGPHVKVSVIDTGVGIPAETIDRILDPFFTTKEQGKGTGLGLSTVLGIVKSHGGFLEISSLVGAGSQFDFYLPTPQTPKPRVHEPVLEELPSGRQELILAVDDEALILSTVRATLENHGYQVLTAANGREAVTLFMRHQQEIRAVFLDMMMPGMDGSATMAALRNVDANIPILATSGMRLSGKVAEAVGAAKADFLEKPYSDEELLVALRKVLGG
jgi:CheY-like chemotaxis protein